MTTKPTIGSAGKRESNVKPSVRYASDHPVRKESRKKSSFVGGILFGTSVDDAPFIQKQRDRLSSTVVINRIQGARKSSSHPVGYMRKLFMIFTSSTVFTILMSILMFIPLSKVIIGAIFFKECPAEPFVPLYLLVGGIIACVRDLVNLCLRSNLTDETYADYEAPITMIALIYTLTEFAWFVCGSFYVFRMYAHFQSLDKGIAGYCSSVLYMYALILTSGSYIILLLMFVITCTTVCVAKCLDDDDSDDRSSIRMVVSS